LTNQMRWKAQRVGTKNNRPMYLIAVLLCSRIHNKIVLKILCTFIFLDSSSMKCLLYILSIWTNSLLITAIKTGRRVQTMKFCIFKLVHLDSDTVFVFLFSKTSENEIKCYTHTVQNVKWWFAYITFFVIIRKGENTEISELRHITYKFQCL
jgi:hypothetical protein